MSANLNNSDFRKLLETPRAERWGSETPSTTLGSAKGGAPKPAKQHGGEHKPHKPSKPSKKPNGAKEEEEDDDHEEEEEEEELWLLLRW